MRIIIPIFAFVLLAVNPVWGQNQQNTNASPPGDTAIAQEVSPNQPGIDSLPETAPNGPDEPAEPAEDQSQAVDSLLAQARAAYGKRDELDSLLQAIELFQQVRQLRPEDTNIALEYCRSILWLEGYYFRGNVNEKLIQEGIVITRDIMTQQPDNIAAHYMHGLLNGFHGKYIESLGSFAFFNIMEDELLWVEKHNSNFDYGGIYRAWGNYYAQLPSFLGGDMEKAEVYYLHVMELHPEYYLNNILLALLYQKQEKWLQAYETLQVIIDSRTPLIKDLAPEWHMWKERAMRITARLDEKAPEEIKAAFYGTSGQNQDSVAGDEAGRPEADEDAHPPEQPVNTPSE